MIGRGMKNWRLSTNISLYFENSTRYRHGRQIGSRLQSTEWCYFNDLGWP